MRIYITQLIYIKEGQEKTFDEFESKAIPIISRYNGKLMLRIRPAPETVIEKNTEPPYEVHLVEFGSEEDFKLFLQDEERKKFLHLKDQSIRTSFLIKGTSL